MKAYNRSRGLAPVFLNIASFQAPSALLPEKDSSTHSIGGWVDQRASLDVLKKKKPHATQGFESRTVQSVA